MADNTELASGSGGDVLRTEDRGSVKTPVSLIDVGGTSSEAIVGDAGVGMPCEGMAAEDAAAAGNPVLIGGRYDATPRTLDDGDVGALAVNSSSQLIVSVTGTVTVGSHAVTNAGTFVVQENGAALTALQLIDDAVYTDGTGTPSKGLGVMGTDGTNPQLVSVTSGGHVHIHDGGNTITVDGTVAATQSGTWNVTNAGTFAVQVDGNALTALQLIDDMVYVDDADWTATTSKHALIGGVYQSSPGSITDGDTGPFRVNANGALHVSIQEGAGSGGTSATDDAAFTAGSGAGTPAMGFFSSDTVNAGDVGVLAMDASRRLLVSIEADNVGIGGGTQYTEDGVVPGNPVGNATLAERDDSLAGITPAEGDWTHLFANANGALWVAVNGTVTVASHAVTNAGTFAVQESGSALTALQLIDNVIYVDDADWTATTSSHALIGGIYQSSPGSITDGDTGPIRLTQNGAAHVAIQNTVTVASHAVTNAGTFAVQVDGNALTALQLIDDPVFADDAAFTIGTSKVMMAGATVDESSTDSADEGDAVAVRATANRQLVTTVRPNASGEGLDIFRSIDLDESEEEIKGSAGKLYGYYFYNASASVRYLKFYNDTAANVTVGSTTPVLTLPLPPTSAGHVEFTNGIPFSAAITAAATTGLADADTGAPSANDVIVNVLYK